MCAAKKKNINTLDRRLSNISISKVCKKHHNYEWQTRLHHRQKRPMRSWFFWPACNVADFRFQIFVTQLYCSCISHWLFFSMHLVCISSTHADNRSDVSQVLHKHTHTLTHTLSHTHTNTDTDAESQNHWQLLNLKWAASACSVKALLIESTLQYAPCM